MNDHATLELPAAVYEQLASLAEAEQVAVPVLIERLAAAHRRPLPMASQGALLGEAVPYEEIHVWDRYYDDTFQPYVGDYAD